jgi:hypothetical protein
MAFVFPQWAIGLSIAPTTTDSPYVTIYLLDDAIYYIRNRLHRARRSD